MEIAVFEAGGSVCPKISGKKGRLPPTILRVGKLELTFHMVYECRQRFVSFCHNHAFDRQTDAQRKTGGRLRNEYTRTTPRYTNDLFVHHLFVYLWLSPQPQAAGLLARDRLTSSPVIVCALYGQPMFCSMRGGREVGSILQ